MKRTLEKIKLFRNYKEAPVYFGYAPFRFYSIGKYSQIKSISKPFWKKLQVEGFTGWEVLE